MTSGLLARALLWIVIMRVSGALKGWPAALVIVSVAVTAAPALLRAVADAQQRVDPVTASLKDFEKRTSDYVKLHKQMEAKVGPVPKSANPAAITGHEQALGEAIRAARGQANGGEIFTPQVASVFRRLIDKNLAARSQLDRHAFLVSQPDVTLHVNDTYPSSIPLGTVPAGLLKALPVLPDGLEYRFVNNALVLRDRTANMVVDILPDAVPARFQER